VTEKKNKPVEKRKNNERKLRLGKLRFSISKAATSFKTVAHKLQIHEQRIVHLQDTQLIQKRAIISN